MVDWPEVAEDGSMRTPHAWRFEWKAANGGYDHYPRKRFNTGRLPDFHVLWGRSLTGGYVRAPLAEPSRTGLAFCDLDATSDIDVG